MERDNTILVSFDALGWKIAFTDCPDVVDGLETILHGWGVRRLPRTERHKPHAHVTRTARGYRWQSDGMPKPRLWDRNPPVSTMSVVTDVHDVFFDWFLKENPRYLCLHGAAVRFRSGLVCFPSVHNAGKSTLCVALAALSQTLYGDDVLPIEPKNNLGVAMGITPLLRRPLSARVGSRLTDFVAQRSVPVNKRWVYLRLDKKEIAPLGEQAPITALVLLKRKNRSRAKLEPVARSEMLREVISQNFARHVPPAKILDRLLRIVEGAECYRLQYGRVFEAAELVLDTFGRKPRRAANAKART